MKLLAHIMKKGWPDFWFLYPEYSAIINHAHKLGLVFRGSHSQVHWTDKGISLYQKYVAQ